MNTRHRTGGFTLIEQAFVIATIGILAAILLPGLARSREMARRSSCLVNLTQLGMAMHMYADEHAGQLPWSGGANNAACLLYLHTHYLPEYATFVCPSDAVHRANQFEEKDAPESPNTCVDEKFSLRASYDYLGAYTHAPIVLPPLPAPIPRVPIMWDLTFPYPEGGKPCHRAENQEPYQDKVTAFNHVPGGGNVLWLDGSVTFLKGKEWAENNLPAYPAGISFDSVTCSEN